MGTWDGAERPTVFDRFLAGRFHGYAVDVGAVGEPAGVGGIASHLAGTILEVDHLEFLLLEEEDAEWGGLGVGRTAASGGGGVLAADEPATARLPLEGGDVLVAPVDEDDVLEAGVVGKPFDVAFRDEPFVVVGGGGDAVESALFAAEVGDGAVASVAFGGGGVVGLEEGYRLVAFHSVGVGNAVVAVSGILLHQRCFLVAVLIVLHHNPGAAVALHILDFGECLAYLLPLETALFVLVFVVVVEGVAVVEELTVYLDISTAEGPGGGMMVCGRLGRWLFGLKRVGRLRCGVARVGD